MFHKQLTWACDLIILNACSMTILQAWLMGMNWLWGLTLLNCMAVIFLRRWLMSTLQIAWLDSWLNRGLKRIADIATACIFLLTVFPLIIVIQAIIIRTNKCHKGPLIRKYGITVGENRNFHAFLFCNCTTQNRFSLGMTPLALQLLTGKISLSDLPYISIMPCMESNENSPVDCEERVEETENLVEEEQDLMADSIDSEGEDNIITENSVDTTNPRNISDEEPKNDSFQDTQENNHEHFQERMD